MIWELQDRPHLMNNIWIPLHEPYLDSAQMVGHIWIPPDALEEKTPYLAW